MARFKFDYVRHAKAVSGPVNMSHTQDMQRVLDDEGIQQAEARRVSLGNPRYDALLISPAVRCEETASLIAVSDMPWREVPEMTYDPATPVGALLEPAFPILGNLPVKSYVKEGYGCIVDHGRIAWDAVIEAVELEGGLKERDKGWRVLLTGHSPLLASMGLRTLRGSGLLDAIKILLDLQIPEAGGFSIDVEIDRDSRAWKATSFTLLA